MCDDLVRVSGMFDLWQVSVEYIYDLAALFILHEYIKLIALTFNHFLESLTMFFLQGKVGRMGNCLKDDAVHPKNFCTAKLGY